MFLCFVLFCFCGVFFGGGVKHLSSARKEPFLFLAPLLISFLRQALNPAIAQNSILQNTLFYG